jgi:lipopolysaccharide/colanic/teichoic acid biosynthesis glycosyltransferase
MSNQLPSSTSLYAHVKVVVDVLAALLLLVVCAPLLLFSAVLVKLGSRGPILYTQVRLGKKGRPFTIFKIRTMFHNCESLTGAQWSLPGDLRITPVGRFLRRSHLDELPQLFNVLRGDMSLVGPRPERPEFFPTLVEAFPQYRERLAVRPGVTGLAQVQLPPDSSLDSVRRKLTCDLEYIRRVSFWLDVRILVCTTLKVLYVPMDLAGRLLYLTPYTHEALSNPVQFTAPRPGKPIEVGSLPAEVEDRGLVSMVD